MIFPGEAVVRLFWRVVALMLIAAGMIGPQLLTALLSPQAGRAAERWGRRPVLLFGFSALPLRGALFAATTDPNVFLVIQLIDAVGDFTALMRRAVLPASLAGILPNAIGISRYYRDSVDLAQAVQRLDPALAPQIAEAAAHFRAEAAALVDAAVAEPFDEAGAGERMASPGRQYPER